MVSLIMSFINYLAKIPLFKWFFEIPFIKKCINRETISYLYYGVLTTIVNYGVYEICKLLLYNGEGDIPTYVISISTIVAWILAVLFAFITNKLWVFNSKSMELKVVAKEFSAFVLARLFSGVCDLGWMVLVTEFAGMNDSLAKILANVFVMIMNYFFSKLFIFKNN